MKYISSLKTFPNHEHPRRKRTFQEGMNATVWGGKVADETAEKFISSLGMFVWCECPCRKCPSHGGGVWAQIAKACPVEELPGKLNGIVTVFVKIYF
jgi:hypothetical protein